MLRSIRRFALGFSIRKRFIEMMFIQHECENIIGRQQMKASRAAYHLTKRMQAGLT
jgi:hypothetical protein